MSTFLGRHRSFCWCDLPQLGIELRFSLEVKRSKSARQSRAEELRVSRLLNSIRRQSLSSQQLVTGSNWLSTRFQQALLRLTVSSSSTRCKQLRLPFGLPQRDPRGPVQSCSAENVQHERIGASTAAVQ